ncbi:hypothetical protein ACNKHM_07730 [Shigella sonnei]
MAYDFGAKANILRMLVDRGCRLTIVPAQTSFGRCAENKSRRHLPLQRSWRPGPCDYAITAIQKFLETDIRYSASASAISCWRWRAVRRLSK